MHLRRSAKAAVLKGLTTRMLAGSLATRGLLRGIKMEFDEESLASFGGEIRPTALVSVDFDVTRPSRFDDNRKGTSALVELAESHGIPITWAICGKTAVEDRKAYNAILNSSGNHEIGVHTYSHIDATTATKDEFREDVTRCIRTLELDAPATFIFPWNKEAHFDVLEELGFEAFRGKKRVIGLPVRYQGLWNMRPVYYMDQKSQGAESMINAYVDFCVKRAAFFHLWTHPWGLTMDGDTSRMSRTLDSVFAHIEDLRKKGRLTTLSLGDAAQVLNRQAGLDDKERDFERPAEARTSG